MQEVKDILAEIVECRKVILDPSLNFNEKRNAFVDAGELILPKIEALLSTNVVIDKNAATWAKDSGNVQLFAARERDDYSSEDFHSEFMGQIQLELTRIAKPVDGGEG